MTELVKKSFRTVARVWRWVSGLMGFLCLLAALMVLFGQLNIDADLNGIDQLNPYLVIVLVGASVLLLCSVILIALLFPIVYLWNLIQNKKQVQ
jgi:hypothetical protein